MKSRNKTIVWWGRSDPTDSRNAIMIQALEALGWSVSFFRPRISVTANIEALFRLRKCPSAIWVPAFRQRDYFAARRFARLMDVPIIFDPLISTYEKRVFEFKKIKVESKEAQKLLRRERMMFSTADLLLADTVAHKAFFEQELGAEPERCFVVPVGADANVFTPQLVHSSADPQALSAAVRPLLTDRAALESCGAQARQTMEPCFTQQQIVDCLGVAFKNLEPAHPESKDR